MTTSFSIDPKISKKLDKICSETGLNRSSAIRKLIEDFDSNSKNYESKKLAVLESIALEFRKDLNEAKKDRNCMRKATLSLLSSKVAVLANDARKENDIEFASWLLRK